MFVRAAHWARSAVCRLLGCFYQHADSSQATTTRLYSTEVAAKKSNLSLYLVGAGLAAAGAYGYTTLTVQEKPKKILTSALDPQQFVDIKLKRIEPYNHNTAT